MAGQKAIFDVGVHGVHPGVVVALDVAEIIVVEIAETPLADSVLGDEGVAARDIFVDRVDRLIAA